MSIALTPDVAAVRSNERQRSVTPDGANYARVLTINTDARIAFNSAIHDICSVDKVARPPYEEAMRKDLEQIAADAFPGTSGSLYVPSLHPKDDHLNDAIIDRVSPTLPATSEVVKEVRSLLQHAPANQDPSITDEIGRNLVGLYAARVLEDAIQIRSDEVSLAPGNAMVTSLPVQIQQAQNIIGEIKQFGLEDVRVYYTCADILQLADNEVGVDAVRKKIDQYPLHQETRLRLALLLDQAELRLKQKSSEKNKEKKKPPSKPTVARNFMDDLQETYAYINSMTPEEQKGFLTELPLLTLELIHRTRTFMNMVTDRVATSSELREMFWQLRLGRQVGDFLKNHPLQYAKPADLNRYIEHLYDRLLRSEAAGFEIRQPLPPQAGGIPTDEAIAGMVQTLFESDRRNFPGPAKPVLFTVIVNESVSVKVHIPAGATPEKIRQLVASAKREQIPLTEKERAQLTYNGYKPSKERGHDAKYRHLYGHGQKEKVPGDYLVCVSNTTTPDRTDPTTLFHVGPHKAAVAVSLGEKPEMSIIYNHTQYDGVPAKKTYQEIRDGFMANVRFDGQAANHYLTLSHILDQEKGHSDMPITEGVGETADNFPYQKITVSGPKGDLTLSPTDVRAIVIGLANDIDYMHHLFAGALPEEYGNLHPTHNNVQPNIIGFESLRRALNTPELPVQQKTRSVKRTLLDMVGRHPQPEAGDLNAWVANFTTSTARCKQGKGPAATLSAVTGTWEGPLAAVSALMHPGTEALMHTNGMFSSVFDPRSEGDPYRFTTAHSDAYSPRTSDIDLNQPHPSVGVIGYSQEGKNGLAITTCRKFPGQAQVELRNSILRWFTQQEQNSPTAHKTLEYMTELVREWDKLAHSRIRLSDYQIIRDRVFDLLQQEEGGKERLAKANIQTPAQLQLYLNQALRDAAQETLNPARLKKTYEVLTRAITEAQSKSS